MPHQILFYDADQGKALYGTWVHDGKYGFALDQDALDLIRWGDESPNVEANPYENLREVLTSGKIYLKSGRVRKRTRKRENDFSFGVLKLVEDDGYKQKYRLNEKKT